MPCKQLGEHVQELDTRALEESRAKLRQFASLDDNDDDVADFDDAGPHGDAENKEPNRGAAPERQLWVQQYAPRSYMQLLSSESINVKVCPP